MEPKNEGNMAPKKEDTSMWEEIRTPEGKLLFRINRDEKLVEGKKGEWVVTASLKGKEVKVERKVPQKKTN